MKTNMITGMEIEKREDDGMERNVFTGCFQKRKLDIDREGLEHDPLTGGYRKVEKSDKPLWPSLLESPVEKSDDEFEAFAPFIKADADKQIVYSVVYSPDTVDSQGDEASAEEIEKTAHDFLVNSRVMKVMHKGKQAKVEVIESYIAPEDFELGKQVVSKGTWVVAAHVSDKKIWKAIVAGKLTGFSMAGYARTETAA